MSLFVNPITKKLASRAVTYAGDALKSVYKPEKRFFKSIFGSSSAVDTVETLPKWLKSGNAIAVEQVGRKIDPLKIKFDKLKKLREELNALIKIEKRGVIEASNVECDAILKQLDTQYLKKVQATINPNRPAREMIRRYKDMLDNEIQEIGYRYNQNLNFTHNWAEKGSTPPYVTW